METTSPPSLSATDHSIGSEEGPTSFFCRQCQSAYRQPKILRCLHSFCSPCLRELVEKTADEQKTVICPLCACATEIPSGGVDDLTSNSFLHRISNDYVKEVKHNLASKSLRDGSSSDGTKRDDTHKHSGEFGRSTLGKAVAKPGIKSEFHDELEQHRFTNLTDEQKSETSRVLSSSSSSSKSEKPNVKTDGESSANVREAIQNMNRLQAKSMGLQGEALRVTYAIDHVNNHKEEWLQRREDLKRAIQRRSAQFQNLVKKMERHLISQIEDKSVEDKFHGSLDRGKTELRKNLKQVLHEVSVIKSVREMGKYGEINELSPALLSPSVGVGEVILDDIKYQFDLPTKTIEEMVRVGFGNLVTTHEKKSVYAPDLKDYANLGMEEMTSVQEKSYPVAFKAGGILSAISGDSGTKSLAYRSTSVVGRQSLRRSSDVGRADAMLEEFQNARESLRNRRQEILRQGHNSRDSSPWRGGGGGGAAASVRRVSRPTARKGRVQVQSLDRSSNLREETKLLSKIKTTSQSKGDDQDSFTSSVEVYDVSTGGLTDSFKLDDTTTTTMPSPIIEEAASSLDSPKMEATPKLSSGVSSPITSHRQRTVSCSSNDTVPALHEVSRTTRGQISSPSSASSSRRVSFDMSPSMSPTSEHFPIELFGKNIENSRQLRKAITGAADKRAKIEFLRENWQRRKEILIQNRGFVSSDESTSTAKPDSSSVSALVSEQATTPENGTTKYENSTHTEIPLASRGIGSPPLRSKFTSVRKTQINETRYQGSPDTSRSPSISGGSPKVMRKSEIPPSLLDKELRKIEATNTNSVTTELTGRALSNKGIRSNLITDNAKQVDKNEQEEEETVVETETISIPLTSELLQDTKSPQREVRIASESVQSVTGGTSSASLLKTDSKTDEEQDEVTFFEDTVTVPLPIVKTSVSSSQSSGTPQSAINLSSFSSTAFSHSTSTSLSPKTSIAESHSGSSSTGSTFRSNDGIRSSYYSSTRTTDVNNAKGDTTDVNNAKGDTTDAKGSASYSISDRTPSFFQRGTNETKTTNISSDTAVPSLSSGVSSSITPSKVTNTTTAAATMSTTTTNRATLSSTFQSHTTTMTTTTTTTTPTPTSSYNTFPTSRRYVPKTETIDVAALFSNFYKAPSSTKAGIDRDAKGKAPEDNKENVSSAVTATSKPQSRIETSSNLLNNKTNISDASTKTESQTKTEFREEKPSDTGKNEITSKTTHTRYGSSFLRNYYSSSTESRYITRGPAVKDDETAKEKEAPQSQTSSVENSTRIGQSVNKERVNQETEATKTRAVSGAVTSTESVTTTTRTFTTNSLYSKYYSNPNALYSKPIETTSTRISDDKNDPGNTSSGSSSRQTAHDQKVHETFTQAESARRVYEPPPNVSSDQPRRHTADISKTIPTGVKISELYSKSTKTDDNSPVAQSSRMSSQSRTTIKESPVESLESENILSKPQQKTASLYSPSSYYSSQITSASSSTGARAENLQQHRQQSLPERLDFKPSQIADVKQESDDGQLRKHPNVKSPPGPKPTSLSYHHDVPRELSTASSPADSPLVEDKELFMQSGQFEDSSGAMGSSSGSRSLKDIARKKRERWRRLTVY